MTEPNEQNIHIPQQALEVPDSFNPNALIADNKILTGHNIADELCSNDINGAGFTGGNIGPIFHLANY